MFATGFDVHTKDKDILINALRKLEGVESVEDGGMYWEDNHYSQVHVRSVFTESELEAIAYKANLPYVGTFWLK